MSVLAEICGAVLAACVVLFVGVTSIVGAVQMFAPPPSTTQWQRDAVAHGCAAFTMDPATGVTRWAWNGEAE